MDRKERRVPWCKKIRRSHRECRREQWSNTHLLWTWWHRNSTTKHTSKCNCTYCNTASNWVAILCPRRAFQNILYPQTNWGNYSNHTKRRKHTGKHHFEEGNMDKLDSNSCYNPRDSPHRPLPYHIKHVLEGWVIVAIRTQAISCTHGMSTVS